MVPQDLTETTAAAANIEDYKIKKISVISLTNHHLKLDAEQTPKMLFKQFLTHRYSTLTSATQY